MRLVKRFFQFIMRFMDKLQKAHIGAYSAQAAFFLMLSGIPLMMLFLALIQYTPMTKSAFLEFLDSVFPSVVMPFVLKVTEEVYTKSLTLISVSAIITIWSAARAVLSITYGINSIFGITETRNYFVLRFRAALQTVFFLVAIIFAILLIVFSEQRLEFLANRFPVVSSLMYFIGNIRFVLVFAVELLAFMFIYKLLPNRKGNLAWQIPGALFAAIGWSAFSSVFSIYIGGFSNMSYMYGSLTTVIVFMLWLYFCMYILLIGAGISACVERYPRLRKWEKLKGKKKKEVKVIDNR